MTPQPPHAGAQVSGSSILGVLAAMGAFRSYGERILREAGVNGVDAGEWYPLDALVAALQVIEREVGPRTLFLVGTRAAERFQAPARAAGIEAACLALRAAYGSSHRAVDESGRECVPLGADAVRVVSRTPYPCEFEQGVLQGVFARVAGGSVRIVHEEPYRCKRLGSTACTYLVERARTPPQ